MLRGTNQTLQLTGRFDPAHLLFVWSAMDRLLRQKETAMIIELGKITLRTCGGGQFFREDFANVCVHAFTDFIQDSC
jgi:hypothetical protein